MNKQFARVISAAALLFVFFAEPPAPALGQGIGVYRGRQGRRVGRVTLPTPPYNPHAGILHGRGGRGHDSPKTARGRSTRRGVKAAKRNPATVTPRKRRVRRR